tara:strand:- start:119 stop:337 length:219 start_codon:yes stop_codon:yes gene_type:complete
MLTNTENQTMNNHSIFKTYAIDNKKIGDVYIDAIIKDVDAIEEFIEKNKVVHDDYIESDDELIDIVNINSYN